MTARPYRLPGRRWLAGLILPVLLLRALVPAGFMLASVDGDLSVVLCDGGALHAGHPGHHHHYQHSGTPHASDPTCPFAQSAGAAPLPSFPPLADRLLATGAALAGEHEQTLAPPGPHRQHPARAPPLSA